MPHCNDAYRRTRPARSRLSASRGFTLLELLLVVTVLSAVAWMTLGTVSNNSDQIRFEDTRNRLAAIRRAIIGDTSRTVNGGPEIRGYVADMGGLPENINALISKDYCRAPENSNKENEVALEKYCVTKLEASACDDGCVWVTQPAYEPASASNYWLAHGWNGPYLTATEYSGYPRLQDGWGNQVGAGLQDSSKRDSDVNSFGWVFHSVPVNDGAGTEKIHLAVRSLGKDGVENGSSFDADYPVVYISEDDTTNLPSAPDSQWLITDRDYRIKVTESNGSDESNEQNGDGGGLSVNLGSPTGCWKCSPSKRDDRTSCEAIGGKWLNRGFDEITCKDTSTGNFTKESRWVPIENLCMAVAYRNFDDSHPTTGQTTVNVKKSSNYSEVKWDGLSKRANFAFEDITSALKDFFLPLGSVSYRIYPADSALSCENVTLPNPANPLGDENKTEAERWQQLNILPGSGL